jgi:hypothetical protein
MLMVIPDPDQVASGDPQEIPGVGVFPVAVADTGKSKAEWEKQIKAEKLPLVVKDVRSEEKQAALTEKTEEE